MSDAYVGRVKAVEQTWRERYGADAVSNLRQVLENVADQYEDASFADRPRPPRATSSDKCAHETHSPV